ncbi:MAG TPA: NADH-quinone oxidoreductase subunit C [Chloroflexota bacterium]
MSARVERLQERFPNAAVGVAADGIPHLAVSPEDVPAVVQALRDDLGYVRFVDLTAVDDPEREDRFELNYLLYSMDERCWVRVKTRTSGEAPSIAAVFPGANWYEREVYDLFGVRFSGHPNLTRILMPDDWEGHPLRRDEPLGEVPVDFTVTRDVYGT